MALARPLRYFESRALVYRHTWRGSAITTFLNPLLFLGAMGLGLGTLVDDGQGRATLDGLTYLEFLAPGLLAAFAMQTAAGDSSFPVMAGIKWVRDYEAALATPLRTRDLVYGHVSWVAARVTFVSTVFIVIMALFGAVEWGRGLLALGPALLTGMAFGPPIMAFTSTLDHPQGISSMFRFMVTPMFLFSGTFFPVEQLPGWLQPAAYLTPLWHGVELARGVALGTGPAWDAWVHVVYLVAFGVVGTALAVRLLRKRMVV
ncbi:MAG: ABC transporter permease [Proteobacteria bacterium]|nr:ABC transporter permease [Pseudomonadota bacterium]